MVYAYLIPNSVFNLISGLVALAVSYYAFKYRKVTESGFLRIISFGFMLLGIGLVTQASIFLFSAFNIARITDRVALLYDATILYLGLQVVAFALIGVGYANRMHGAADKLRAAVPFAFLGDASTPVLFGTYTLIFGQLLIVVLTAVLAFQEALVYGEQKSRLSLTVLGGFAFIFLGHLGQFGAALLGSGELYLVGGIGQLAGFGLLLLFVLWSGSLGSD